MRTNQLTLAISQIIGISLLGIQGAHAKQQIPQPASNAADPLSFSEPKQLTNSLSDTVNLNHGLFASAHTITLSHSRVNKADCTASHTLNPTSASLNQYGKCLKVNSEQPGKLQNDLISEAESSASDARGLITILVDTVDFNTATDGFCSLPEALSNANYDSETSTDCAIGNGADVIGFAESLNGLTITATNRLTLSSEVTIDGPGADQLTLSGGNSNAILYTTNSAIATINGLSLVNGTATLSGGGGAILNHGYLTINNSAFSNNSAQYGGAVASFGSLILNQVTMDNNQSEFGAGAVTHSPSASLLHVSKSLFAFNSNGPTPYGAGAISVEGPSATIDQSSFLSNTTSGSGGAIFQRYTNLTITNSTFDNNVANNDGGAIAVVGEGATTDVIHSTFYNNTASLSSASSIDTSETLNLINSILAGNVPIIECTANAIDININNLVDDGSCSSNAVNQLIGDPMLAPLADVGNLTLALMPMEGSPVIDSGSLLDCAQVDQRDMARPIDGDVDGSSDCDIGSIEAPQADLIFEDGFDE